LAITQELLEATSLRVGGKIGTGIDNIDLTAAAELGVSVTYTPGLNALSVAEHTLGLVLAVLRRTVHCRDVLVAGGWRDETPLGKQLSGRTVGIVGLGNIGSRFAGLLRGFNAQTLAHDPYVQPEDTEILGVDLVEFETLLDRADVVSVNTDLTDETCGMFGPAAFERMHPSSVLINTARGPIVQQDALVSALRTGMIAGAGLDVFETEPLPPSSPLHEFNNVVVTPHVAARTETASGVCVRRLAQNVVRLLEDRSVPERYLAVPP
jgi:phosphoglycerate dehydrogenase-like enzyme